MRHLRTAWHRFAASLFLSTILALPANAGTFATHVDYAAGVGPSGVAASDFNGDGKLDLAVANDDPNNGTVSVLLGNGDGTFQPAASYPVGTYPQAVAVADFNGDGKQDVVMANDYSNKLSVLVGKGDGTFQSAVNYDVGGSSFPVSVAVADFNGDKRLDLVVTDIGAAQVSVLLGNGDGTFGT